MTEVTADSAPAAEECQHCGALVPVGAFCGSCGASLVDQHGGRDRLHSYSASPGEHVGHATVISTLFPHLPHRHAHAFRQVFAAGLGLVVLLAALRLYAPATMVAALLLPVLYILYLYEVEVYEHEPLTVLAVTFGLGTLLGIGDTLLVGRLITAGLQGPQQGVLVAGVLLPALAQVLMVACPLLLLGRSHFDEALDGLTFGVATALGFTMATVVTGFWYLLTAPLQGGFLSTEDILRLLRAGILVALVNASATGMITAALWSVRHGRSRGRHTSAWRALPVTAVVAFGMQVLLGVLSYYIASLLLLVAVWAAAAVALLTWLRVILHHALLDEGLDHILGEPTVCSECHRLVPSMRFCPACGATRAVAPKRLRTRHGGEPAPAVTGEGA